MLGARCERLSARRGRTRRRGRSGAIPRLRSGSPFTSAYVCVCWIRSASTPTRGSCRLLLLVRLCLDPLPRYDRFSCPRASSVTCSSSRTRRDSRRILVPIWSHSWSKTVPPCTPSYVLRVPSRACCPRSVVRREPSSCCVADYASRMACKRSGVRIPIAPLFLFPELFRTKFRSLRQRLAPERRFRSITADP